MSSALERVRAANLDRDQAGPLTYLRTSDLALLLALANAHVVYSNDGGGDNWSRVRDAIAALTAPEAKP